MNYFRIMGISNEYTEKELDDNYYKIINLILPYLYDCPKLVDLFMNVETSYDFLKDHKGSISISNAELESNKNQIVSMQEMFKSLSNCFHISIKITYVSNGAIIEDTGFIDNLINYDNIKLINGSEISFLNYDEAIIKICDDKNNILYNNPLIDCDYNINSEAELRDMYEQSYGETIGISYFEINKINKEDKTSLVKKIK